MIGSALFCRAIKTRKSSIVTSARTLSSSSVFNGYCVDSLPEERMNVLIDKVLPPFAAASGKVATNNTARDDLNKMKGAVKLAMVMRKDLNAIATSKTNSNSTHTQEASRACDTFLKQWLGSCFCADSLELRRITFDHSSGNVLEKVARGESVHRVRSLSELKRRLHDGRRAFALFHHCLPDEPLVFVHVALTSGLATSISQLDVFKSESSPTHAMFYSINSPIAVLSGLDLGSFLLAEVVTNLRATFPLLNTFSTLSPVPSFNKWLRTAHSTSDSTLLHHLQSISSRISPLGSSATTGAVDVDALTAALGNSKGHEDHKDLLKEPLMYACAYYLTKVRTPVKQSRPTTPMDPVARFHLRNGASLHSLNWMSNPSSNGLMTSCGMMVNYLYDLDRVTERKAAFTEHSVDPESTLLFHTNTTVTDILQ